ncbi:bifunctional adenosylcobinamide kinase/adenosylcobinamide-phosphate guanylyltransferase [Thermaerobacillus caldiproteolyticus]|uniref:Adenosyl cobinamide kinase/adenosyl cobinamide phosphate guanylyltransferase n=1 Tax=Thermaerobacillus caldiproteolyticus TaxID=247480 RepID=A0A7W0BYC0_9BACL|nr:bifunctional adenosylcobinamide kinase/adenosylcobinamide-phosphate guanylyltransferase [Anoxybacillus caldiproteolyticus]MBA2873266.1 adenosyl cobinamide kinase/adenosyl cobinamide phosphate guanylyltransferase [Anoxybacillus caldiproteolyticus]
MHFIVGGAFQGKRKWARQYYRLDEIESWMWCNGYEREYVLPDANTLKQIIILEGLEASIRRTPSRTHWEHVFQMWHDWEQGDDERTVVWIGCDITQGIVPLTKEERNWRDVTGWCYQELVKRCERVDRVWCGLVERIK